MRYRACEARKIGKESLENKNLMTMVMTMMPSRFYTSVIRKDISITRKATSLLFSKRDYFIPRSITTINSNEVHMYQCFIVSSYSTSIKRGKDVVHTKDEHENEGENEDENDMIYNFDEIQEETSLVVLKKSRRSFERNDSVCPNILADRKNHVKRYIFT